MASTKDFQEKVVAKLEKFGEVKCRPMMGEYSLYLDGVLIGGIYDNRLLLKETAENIKYELPRVIPYDSAKRTMVHVEDLENEEILWGIVLETKEGLTQKNT